MLIMNTKIMNDLFTAKIIPQQEQSCFVRHKKQPC